MIFMVACGNGTNNQGSSEEVNFRWDFSQPKKIIYSYAQEVEADFKMDKEGASDKTKMWGDGQLKVRVKDSKLADLSISDFEIKMVSGQSTICTDKLWAAILKDLNNNVKHADIAFKFHLSLANLLLSSALQLKHEFHFDTIVLSGGVFNNKLLLELIHGLFGKIDNIRLLTPSQIPSGDGGISLGQAAVCAARERKYEK